MLICNAEGCYVMFTVCQMSCFYEIWRLFSAEKFTYFVSNIGRLPSSLVLFGAVWTKCVKHYRITLSLWFLECVVMLKSGCTLQKTA